MSPDSLSRPGLTSHSGYLCDAAGMRSLGEMEITQHGEIEGNMPATVEYKLSDLRGQRFTVIADVAKRMGHVPMVAEPNCHQRHVLHRRGKLLPAHADGNR